MLTRNTNALCGLRHMGAGPNFGQPGCGTLGGFEAFGGIPYGHRAGEAYWPPFEDGGLGAEIAAAATLEAPIGATGALAAPLAGAATVAAPADAGAQIFAGLVGQAALAAGLGARGALAAQILVSQLSQTDVEGAVLEAKVDGTITLRQVLRLLAAVAAGKTTVTDNGDGTAEVLFRDLPDTKNRVQAAMTGSERTSVTLNVS